MERQRGTVKWFSREKGWGFIRLESGEDIFVHHSDIEGEGFVTLEDGQPVEFTVEAMEKGPRARHVRQPGARAPRDERAGRENAGRENAGRENAGREDAVAGAEAVSREDAVSHEEGGRREPDEHPGGPRPLAEQIRERLGRYFPGLGS